MRDRVFAAQLLTSYALNARDIMPAYASDTGNQTILFDSVARHRSKFSAPIALPLSFSRLCFSAFPPSNLNRSRISRAGLSPVALYHFGAHLQPAPLHEFVTNHTLHPRHRRGTMKESNRGIYFHCITNSLNASPSVDFERNDASSNLGQIAERQRLSFSASSHGKTEDVAFPAARCSEKGCVFPASSPDSGKCSYHMHQQEEPVLFRSHQPTGLLLDPARTAPVEKEYHGSRKRDRRRMAVIWEQFQSDGTT
jgi:hypothetical protein